MIAVYGPSNIVYASKIWHLISFVITIIFLHSWIYKDEAKARYREHTRMYRDILSLGVCINRQVQNDIWWRCDRSCSETVCLFLFAWMAMDAHFRLISITLRWANEPWYHHKNHHLRWIFVRLHHKQIKSSTLFLHIICIFSPN